MSREGKFALPLCAFVTLLASAPVHAGKFFNEFEILGQVGSEHYRWTDYNYLGDTVAKESGTTTSARISANNFFRSTNGIIYGAEIGSSDGHGDYYGDAWTGIVLPPPTRPLPLPGRIPGIHASASMGAIGTRRVLSASTRWRASSARHGIEISRTVPRPPER